MSGIPLRHCASVSDVSRFSSISILPVDFSIMTLKTKSLYSVYACTKKKIILVTAK